MWAIFEALSIPEKERQNARNTPATSFCDSQKALEAIENRYTQPGNRFLTSLILPENVKNSRQREAYYYSMDTRSVQITGNERADLLAKTRAEKGGR